MNFFLAWIFFALSITGVCIGTALVFKLVADISNMEWWGFFVWMAVFLSVGVPAIVLVIYLALRIAGLHV